MSRLFVVKGHHGHGEVAQPCAPAVLFTARHRDIVLSGEGGSEATANNTRHPQNIFQLSLSKLPKSFYGQHQCPGLAVLNKYNEHLSARHTQQTLELGSLSPT